MEKSSLFERLSDFLPQFKDDTEDLLNDEERLKACRVEEAIMEPVRLEDIILPK